MAHVVLLLVIVLLIRLSVTSTVCSRSPVPLRFSYHMDNSCASLNLRNPMHTHTHTVESARIALCPVVALFAMSFPILCLPPMYQSSSLFSFCLSPHEISSRPPLSPCFSASTRFFPFVSHDCVSNKCVPCWSVSLPPTNTQRRRSYVCCSVQTRLFHLVLQCLLRH